MDNLTLKLVVTPVLIGAATLAGRRWGQAVGGWLVGLPLTTGPVAFFIALDHGEPFAAAAALGSLGGAAAEAAFSLTYGWLALRGPWPLALLAGSAAFAGLAVALQWLTGGPLLLFVVAIGSLALALRLMPAKPTSPVPPPPPRWDLPARMVLATVVVLLITALAPRLGPRLSGVLATYPLFAAILTAFAHHLEGAGAAVSVLRGLLFGLFAFASFCLVLAVSLVHLGIAVSFAAAIVVALTVQAISLWRLRPPRPVPAP
ncbi:MAG TPA: hypothetical protein VIG07_01840 [Methylomirabilota bacterium]|jgi:hypothetical protein